MGSNTFFDYPSLCARERSSRVDPSIQLNMFMALKGASWLTLDSPAGSKTTQRHATGARHTYDRHQHLDTGTSWIVLRSSVRNPTHPAYASTWPDPLNSITISCLKKRCTPSSERYHLNTGAGACVGCRRQWGYPRVHESFSGAQTERPAEPRCMKSYQ